MAASALLDRWASKPAAGLSRSIASGASPLKSAGAVLDRWAGQPPGTEVPCRSTLIGRTLDIKRKGSPKGPVEIIACAVPHRTNKPSKAGRPSYLGATPGLFGRRVELLEGGKVRNASRTPRETHAGMDLEWAGGEILNGPIQRMKTNELAGRAELSGLDLPFPHRAGSSVCCPSSALSASGLSLELFVAEEDEGAMSAGLRERLGRLAAHLRTRHRVEGLAAPREADDFQRARDIVRAAEGYCSTYLHDWQKHAEEDFALHRVESKKASARKASKRRRDSKRSKTENSRAVKALQRQARRKPAGSVW